MARPQCRRGRQSRIVEKLLNCSGSMGYVTDELLQMVVPIVQA